MGGSTAAPYHRSDRRRIGAVLAGAASDYPTGRPRVGAAHHRERDFLHASPRLARIRKELGNRLSLLSKKSIECYGRIALHIRQDMAVCIERHAHDGVSQQL